MNTVKSVGLVSFAHSDSKRFLLTTIFATTVVIDLLTFSR